MGLKDYFSLCNQRYALGVRLACLGVGVLSVGAALYLRDDMRQQVNVETERLFQKMDSLHEDYNQQVGNRLSNVGVDERDESSLEESLEDSER